MTFAAPELLLGLLLVPAALAVYAVVQRRRARYAVRFTNVDLLANLVPRSPGWRRHLPPALYLAAIAALVIAMARPSATIAVPREEATVMLAIDVSRSMQATDVSPSRMEAAQTAANDFVDQLPSAFRVGLVAFSTDARIVTAPTTDRGAIHDAIDNLRADGGTALGDAIALSLSAAGLDPSSASSAPSAGPSAPAAPTPNPSGSPAGSAAPKPERPIVATVLLSDGANSTGRLLPLDAAQQAARLHVPVYTIALGTADGVVDVPNQQGFMVPLEVPPDPETLAAIAEITGARAFEAPSASDLAQIYDNLGSRIGFTTEQREVTQLFAAAGLAFVLAGAGLAVHWFNRFP